MPRAPRVPDEPDEPDRMEGAPAPSEGPLPPGAPQGAEPVEEGEKSAAELRAEAEARGVMPDEGSGSGGRVVKEDLERALENAPPEPPVGRPPLSMVAEQAAAQIMPMSREEE